ncbi:trypsin-like peptidase domain-containing protein [Sphaerisporangium sp. B11E5]|uniref:S1C family serine protease n=1 Tax=Sphaerisporangium sp. B11E5 TaxID=3153563 RepID=UPI00325F9206
MTIPGGEPESRGWTQFGTMPPRHGAYQPPAGAEPPATIPPGPPPTATPPWRGGFGRKALAGLALAAVAVGGGVTGALVTGAGNDTPAAASPVMRPASDAAGATVADVARAVQPSVVSILVTGAQGQAEGSGVILSSDGLILTNNHVVAGAGQGGQVQVKFSDGKNAAATIVGTDPATDLAVIRAQNVSGLTQATLGDSDKLAVGDAVLAIGSPLGLEGSVTAGIVSALDRTVTVGGNQSQQPGLPPGWGGQRQQSAPTTIGGAIQTDAAINPGNSGGALVNSSGQVVGINSAIATNGGDGNIGVGFAIPINTARQVADQLIKSGKATHAYLGVNLADATGNTEGAVVSTVQNGSPAAQAGLREGDLITKIDGTQVSGADTVVGQIRSLTPGTKVSLTYVRDGRTSTVTVTLAERTAES